jgi:hypothetical protein
MQVPRAYKVMPKQKICFSSFRDVTSDSIAGNDAVAYTFMLFPPRIRRIHRKIAYFLRGFLAEQAKRAYLAREF